MRLQSLKIMEQLILIQTVLGRRRPSRLKLLRACIQVRFSPFLNLIPSLYINESFSGLVWILESTKGKKLEGISTFVLWFVYGKYLGK